MLFFQYFNIFISPSFYDLVSFRLRLVSGTGGRESLLPSEGVGCAGPLCCNLSVCLRFDYIVPPMYDKIMFFSEQNYVFMTDFSKKYLTELP